MAKVQRHLSIHFNIRFFKGITYEEILSDVEKKVELDNIGSVQFTETDYNSSEGLEYEGKLISGGITLKTGQLTF
jgi:hypothetical protein